MEKAVNFTDRRTGEWLRMEREMCDSQWTKAPEEFRCSAVSELLRGYKNRPRSVLEIGCGDRMRDKSGSLGAGFCGGDLSAAALRVAKGRHGDSNFVNLDGAMLPFRDSSFELVVSLQTIHIFGIDTYAAVSEMARVSSRQVIMEVDHEDYLPARLGAPIRNLAFSRERMQVGDLAAIGIREVASGRLLVDATRFYFNESNMRDIIESVGMKMTHLNYLYASKDYAKSRKLTTEPEGPKVSMVVYALVDRSAGGDVET